MKEMVYLETLGFVDVTEQVKTEIRANAKITKAMGYVLQQVDEYGLRFVVNPEHIGEKNIIFFEGHCRANFKYICEVVNNKTSFTTYLPEKFSAVGKIMLDKYTSLLLDSGCFVITSILEAWEFFLTGNTELPHFPVTCDWGTYEKYPQKYREEFRNCEW